MENMTENNNHVRFEKLYGWKTSAKYIVPVEYELPSLDRCMLESLYQHKGHGSPKKGRAIQEYDDIITKEDVIKFNSQLRDLVLKGIMVGKAGEDAKKEAEKYGIEIRERDAKARLKIETIHPKKGS